jgi:hypothetical protein
MAKRIQFTRHELDLINRMAAIASAAHWGEGDYQDWTERDDKPYGTMREKVRDLLDRKGGMLPEVFENNVVSEEQDA